MSEAVAALPRAVSAARSEPVRILWLIDSLNMGGAESLVVPFSQHLERSRWDLSIATLTSINGNPVQPLLNEQSTSITNLGATSLRDAGAFRRLLQLLRSQRIGLIHAHLTYASIWGSLASRLTSVPLVATLHVAPPREGRAERLRDRLMQFALNRWASRTLLVSDALRREIDHIDPRRTSVVHNGIDVSRFRGDRAIARATLRRHFDLPEGIPLIAVVSVLRPGKGVDVLIEAARTLPECRILVIGDGPMRESWTAEAMRAGVGGTFLWAGWRSDVADLLPAADLLVHPTLEDAFPTVLLEAMAAGLPVVASNVGGVPEIVEHDSTGLLIPPRDPARLASAITELLANPVRRADMAHAARARAAERFSTTAWVSRLEEVYREVLR